MTESVSEICTSRDACLKRSKKLFTTVCNAALAKLGLLAHPFLLRSRLPNHDLLLQLASPDRPYKDFFYGFSTLRELQFTETSLLVIEPWQRSGKQWENFKEEGKNVAEKKHQMLGQYARIHGEITFFNYLTTYVLKNEQAMKSRIDWAMEDSPVVRFKVRPRGAFKNVSQYILEASGHPNESIR